MSRVKDLQKQVHKVLKSMDDNQKRAGAIAHLHGVSLAAAMIYSTISAISLIERYIHTYL